MANRPQPLGVPEPPLRRVERHQIRDASQQDLLDFNLVNEVVMGPDGLPALMVASERLILSCGHVAHLTGPGKGQEIGGRCSFCQQEGSNGLICTRCLGMCARCHRIICRRHARKASDGSYYCPRCILRVRSALFLKGVARGFGAVLSWGFEDDQGD